MGDGVGEVNLAYFARCASSEGRNEEHATMRTMDHASEWLETAKPWFKILLAVGMVGIGILHFVQPKPFIRIVPAWLHRFNPRALVLVSGFFEIAGGIGLLLPRTQQLAAWGLIALYVAVFPANVNMAVHRISLNPKRPIPTYLLWLRLPFQLLFIAWAWWFV